MAVRVEDDQRYLDFQMTQCLGVLRVNYKAGAFPRR